MCEERKVPAGAASEMAVQLGRGNGQAGRGFWSSPGTAYSQETVDTLRVMMKESKLSLFQQRQLNRMLQEGDSFPLSCNPTSTQVSVATPPPPDPSTRVQFSSKPQLRPAESCRAGNAYQRERFRPRPTRNLEREKHRLQNIMATGKDGPTPDKKQKPKEEERNKLQIDRFDELCNEIEERQQFLEQMESLGRGKKFRGIIHTEISQKIREMEEIDKRRSSELRQKVEMDERKRKSTCS
ncbi:UPF0193 protein EVG1 isoform X1 [Narcine bancroftii]|uniref:UPF0193 protein EVG1 isoform X1 n=1 Tax=Narcine bancroftii TaxID=1343680 RepID=UPI003831C049